MKKIYTLGGQKGENRPSEPKNRIWGPKISIVVWYIHSSLHRVSKNILLGVKTQNGEKKSLQSSQTEFGAQNQYVRVKKYTFGGQKDENKSLEPKNEIWGPKNKKKKFISFHFNYLFIQEYKTLKTFWYTFCILLRQNQIKTELQKTKIHHKSFYTG
jgi:hypothetical protein